jgi:hypothetical protein
VLFAAKEHLKSDSCGSVGAVFMGADSEALSFPLEAAEPARCGGAE